MALMTLPEETFRIRPWKDSDLWFLVHVAPDLLQMRREMVAFVGDCHPLQLAAVIAVRARGKVARRDVGGLVGVVFFARTWLGSGLVAHELGHAAFRACERRRIRVKHWESRPERTLADQKPTWSASAEEKFCAILEHLTRNFWREAYGRKLA